MTVTPVDILTPRDLSRNLTFRFSALLLLSLILSGGTYFVVLTALTAKEHDSIDLNLAGRQRMLTQKYANDIDQILIALAGSDREFVIEMKEAASRTAELYEATLTAFLEGGEVDAGVEGRIWIPPVQDDNIVQHLGKARAAWEELQKTAMQAVQSGNASLARNDNIRDIQIQTAKAVAEMDHAVFLMQKQSEVKLRRVESYMACAFIIGVVLYVGTVMFVRRKIVVPLASSMVALDAQKYAMDEHTIVASTDPFGKITYANDKFCRISQYSREELIGQDHRIVNSGHHPHDFFAKLWRTIAAGKVWHGEVCNRAKDGSLYWVDTTIVPFRDETGRITQYVAVRTCINERKLAEMELINAKEIAEVANRAKSEFLANMSHEIRTPMTAILGFAENMLDVDQTESEKLSCIHTIRRNGESLLGIINDILDLSKIESGKMEAELISCEPCAIIADVSSLVRVQADAKGLPLNIEYDGAIPKTIHTDPVRLRQILINLVGNAIKFTQAGSIRLVTRFVDDGVAPCMQFDVIDTGQGIPEEEKKRLFQPFAQVDTSSTRKIGGTGLGLTISRRFAEMLGGDITVVESKLGVGSTFRASVATGRLDGVKMLEDPLSATIVADGDNVVAQAPRSDLHGLRILFAEDGPDNQRLISFVLKKAGADVTIKENGKLALDVALAAMNGKRECDPKRPFDLIIMDMQMPEMDGYEATAQLRRNGYTGPIIALTAHAVEGDREKCISAGCNDYATKPIDRKKLVNLILEHVQDNRLNPDTGLTKAIQQLPLRGCRILLAEDNLSNQVLVVGILKKVGAEVTAVKDGNLAVDTALAARDGGKPFDIILMDIQMPMMGGDEATEMLREKAYSGTIIALTAHAMEGDRQKYLKVGFDDYTTKPINRVKLIKTIQTYFRNGDSQVSSDDNAHESLLMT